MFLACGKVYSKEVVNLAYDAAGLPFTLTYIPDGAETGTTYYYITNIQGDVVGITDSEGTLLISYSYEAYGEGYYSSYSTQSALLARINPLCYRGYVYDTGTNLYYLQSRYYDPTLGRFLNADAFAATGQGLLSNNMFAYCGNNPIIRIDSSGMFWNKVGNFFKNIWTSISNFTKRIFGAGSSTTATIYQDERQIIPEPSPITVTSGSSITATVSETGDSSKPISVYADGNIDYPILSSSAGIKINVSDYTLDIGHAVDNTGISLSHSNEHSSSSHCLRLDLSRFRIGYETSSSLTYDGRTHTSYTNYSISGWTILVIYYFLTTGELLPSPNFATK